MEYNYYIMCIVPVFLTLNSMKDRDMIHLCIPGIWYNSRHVVSAEYLFVKLN